jgi:RNA polymerase sporulation-specific sigma factor
MLELFAQLASHMVYLFLGISNNQNFPPPLTAAEERKYIAAMKEGDQKAKNKLIEHNLRLVAHLVKKYFQTYDAQDELISIGSLGLIKAVDSFDSKNGARFATYAAKCIQNEILMFFRSQKKRNNEVSIHETIDVDRDGNPLTYFDVISTEDTIAEDLDLKIRTQRALDLVRRLLTDQERTIIIARYGLTGRAPMTQKDVAARLKISRSYVSRIEKRALLKMRVHFHDSFSNL